MVQSVPNDGTVLIQLWMVPDGKNARVVVFSHPALLSVLSDLEYQAVFEHMKAVSFIVSGGVGAVSTVDD